MALQQKLNKGNIDRAIRDFENWMVANADFQTKNNPGYGSISGVELTFPIYKTYKISVEFNYLMGLSYIPISGSYIGGNATSNLIYREVSYPHSKVDFSGLELSVGVLF